MVFSFLHPASARGSSSTPAPESSSSSNKHRVFDNSDLLPLEPEPPDLRELNNCLEALATVFPDIQIVVLRETLASFDGESRLALAADALLMNRMTWVKGRWRVAGSSIVATDRGRAAHPNLSSTEAFRSAEYISAVKSLACDEFKGLSRSTITAALAESNYSYIDARRTLVDLSSRSWWRAISSVFWRRPPVSLEPEKHSLVIWESSGEGTLVPCLRSTGNAELDRELYAELIAPLKERARVAQEEEDHALAIAVNKEEAEELQSTFECACCFSTEPFEQFTTCDMEGHMICFRCVQHSITEAIFGQGWNRSMDKESGTLRCPAIDAGECTGCIPSDHIRRAILEEKKGAEILLKLEQRLAEHNLLASNLPLIRCPFCSYAEVDDPMHEAGLRVRVVRVFMALIFLCLFLRLCLGVFRMVHFLVQITIVILLLSSSLAAVHQLRLALVRLRRRRRGLKFTCQRPECGRASCLSCNKAWVDIHVCHESSLIALRTQVEQAMSMAVKRVCPRCNTSFVKVDGCNKLTCTCGYKMCYVCRRNIGAALGPDAGYRHFCDHFQVLGNGGPCRQCKRCNLWASENTEVVLRAAREEAERKWRETENRELSGAEQAFLETGYLPNGGGLLAVPEICDRLVENFFL